MSSLQIAEEHRNTKNQKATFSFEHAPSTGNGTQKSTPARFGADITNQPRRSPGTSKSRDREKTPVQRLASESLNKHSKDVQNNSSRPQLPSAVDCKSPTVDMSYAEIHHGDEVMPLRSAPSGGQSLSVEFDREFSRRRLRDTPDDAIVVLNERDPVQDSVAKVRRFDPSVGADGKHSLLETDNDSIKASLPFRYAVTPVGCVFSVPATSSRESVTPSQEVPRSHGREYDYGGESQGWPLPVRDEKERCVVDCGVTLSTPTPHDRTFLPSEYTSFFDRREVSRDKAPTIPTMKCAREGSPSILSENGSPGTKRRRSPSSSLTASHRSSTLHVRRLPRPLAGHHYPVEDAFELDSVSSVSIADEEEEWRSAQLFLERSTRVKAKSDGSKIAPSSDSIAAHSALRPLEKQRTTHAEGNGAATVPKHGGFSHSSESFSQVERLLEGLELPPTPTSEPQLLLGERIGFEKAKSRSFGTDAVVGDPAGFAVSWWRK